MVWYRYRAFTRDFHWQSKKKNITPIDLFILSWFACSCCSEKAKKDNYSSYIDYSTSCLTVSYESIIQELSIQRTDELLDNIVHSYYYVAKSTYSKRQWHIDFQIRNIYISARYHIYSTGSDEDSNSAVIKSDYPFIYQPNAIGISSYPLPIAG